MLYPQLFSSYHIGQLGLKNRIVMAPMETHLANPDGSITAETIAYYRERARGGVGLVITEFTCVDGRDGFSSNVPQLRLDHEKYKAGHARLVAAVKAEGAAAVVQLSHAGRQTKESVIGRVPVSASAVPLKSVYMNGVPRPLADDDIRRIIASYANAARLATLAGYDGAMLHGAHGYLLQQFLSPLMNRRDDEWGGDFERRLRFPIEVIKAVKAEIGNKPLLYRLSVIDGVEGGLTIEDSEKIAPRLCEAGVDAIDISQGYLESAHLILEPMSVGEGNRLPYARRIKQATGKPVICAGVMRWPDKCERAIKDGDADLVSLGRTLLADPMWPMKAMLGKAEDIRPCTSCNWCIRELAQSRSIACAENPRCGRETDPEIEPLGGGQRAMVIGAGPGGMVAALLLDQAGYKVALFERHGRLGGHLITSAMPPGKEKLFWYHRFLVNRLAKSRVKVCLGTTVAKEDIASAEPDVVVLAGGARLAPLELTVCGSLPTMAAADVLRGEVDVPLSSTDRPIIIYGGGETGTETAEYLTEAGHAVMLVTRSDKQFLARNAEPLYRISLLARLLGNEAIRICDRATLEAINDEDVLLMQGDTLIRQPAAAVLLAHGLVPDTRLAQDVADLGIPAFSIGDAVQVARIGEAVRDAYRVVQTLQRLARRLEPIAC